MAEERICVCKLEGNAKESYCGGSISRQEAIERMARAICLCDDDGGCKCKCDKKCVVWKNNIPHAEAALNALLEE